MKKALPYCLLLCFLATCGWVGNKYAQERAGLLLFEDYFKADPANGYSTQRGLAQWQTPEASILRQAINYHQAGEYDLSLVAFRAYLEGEPHPGEADIFLLAATAASASGEYAEAGEYLDQVTPDDGRAFIDASWHKALLALRSENLIAARNHLTIVKERAGRTYPVGDLLKAIES